MIIYFDKLKCFLINQYIHIVLMYFHVFWIERHLCGLPVLYVRSGDVCFRYVHFLHTGNQESCAGRSHRFRWRWCNSNRGKEWERQMHCRIKKRDELGEWSSISTSYGWQQTQNATVVRYMKIRCRKLIFTNRTPTDRVNVGLND